MEVLGHDPDQATGAVSGLWRPAPVLGLWRASDPESKAALVGQPTGSDRQQLNPAQHALPEHQ
jgi:hypothetical protein